MPNITTTEVNDSIATIIAAEALGYLKANTVLARIVNRNYENEVATHGQSVKIPFAGALSTNDKAVNTVVTLQAPADTAVTLTLNKHKEVSFLLEDTARALARPDWLSVYARDGMAKLAEQIDSDIGALYSGLSQTIDATSTSGSLTEADFREARRLLNAAKAPQSGRWAVLHEDAEYEALGIEKITNRDYAESLGQMVADSLSGRFAGFNIVMSQNIPVAATQCKNLFLHSDAIVFATRPLPTDGNGKGVTQVVMSEDGIGLRVTISYNPDHLGLQVTIDVLYGVAELRDAFGVVVSTTEL